MKLFERFAYVIVIIGFTCKLFHLPFHTWIIMLGLALLFVCYTITAIKKRKTKIENIAGFTITLTLTALLFNLKFYPYGRIVYIVACLAAIEFIGLMVYKKQFARGYFALWIFAAALLNTFRFMPASTKYYFWCVKYNYAINEDYFTWDKYSWFLYCDGKYDEALDANANAFDILISIPDEEFRKLVNEHHDKIVSKTWTDF